MNKESIQNILGNPTDISEKDGFVSSFSETAFNLYKETSIVAIAVSNMYYIDNKKDGSFSIYQAIEAGLIVRITKFMGSVLALFCDGVKEHGEVIFALNRCIIESAINLKFFCEHAKEEDYDNFIKSSLKPEMDLFNTIQKRIAERGKKLPIETRMLKSINRVFENSGVSNINELKSIPRRQSFKAIMESVGMGSSYPMLQGVPSHSIHGTWVDILQHHLEVTDSGFIPKPESITPDTRQLCPINMLVLTAIHSYVKKHFSGEHEEVIILLKRIDDLIDRNEKLDSLHEKHISSDLK